ncbi:hypothetical protein LDENG_00264550 [Lucifuga dentata]|nr:hypothetical protein LDENG_00264550 [Lucifuga dentata]
MVELCEQIFTLGIDEHERREAEVSSFFSGLNEGVAENQQEASKIVTDFEQHCRQRIAELVDLQSLPDTDQLEAKLTQYKDEIDQVCDTLMRMELRLVIQLEDVIKRFDRNISEMVGNFIETLFEDKALVMDALITAHDNHLLKINDRETQLVMRVNAWKTSIIAGILDKERKRNHNRIAEIHRYMDNLKEELEDLQ